MPIIKYPPILDISHWIPVDDFRVLDPMPWMILTKATEGMSFLDAQYAEYADQIRDAGIRLGAYHFMRPGDEIAQAEWFCEIVLTVGLRGDEILACDMEVPGITLAEIKNFLDRVQLRTGIRPLIYSTEMMLEQLYTNGICPAWLKAEWLWIAEYPGNPDLTNEIPTWIVPQGLTVHNIALWQYTDDGIIAGVDGNNVDLNLINPTYAQAIALTEPIPGGEPTMPPTQYYVVTSTNSLEYRTIRAAPIVSAAGIGRMAAGTHAKAYTTDIKIYTEPVYEGTLLRAKAGDRWVHVFENNGAPVDGWMAEIHLGVRYVTLELIGDPPPPPPSTLPTIGVSLRAQGYPEIDLEWIPNP
jgi:GH25 family lysozyme M1 (1,4-beta-N-acetylmuramidase)